MNGPIRLDNRVQLNQRGLQGIDSQDGAVAQDPSQLDLKRLIEEIQRLVKQLLEAQQAKQEAGGAPAGGAKGPEAAERASGSPLDLLSELMRELEERRRRNPEAVANAQQAVPGGQQAVLAAQNITSAASAPAGIPAGFA